MPYIIASLRRRYPFEPVSHYQIVAFTHVIAGGAHGLTDDQLDQAEAGGVQASTARGLSPDLADRYTHARHTIATIKLGRAALAAPGPESVQPVTVTDRPNLGPMAPLMPVPIVRPPSGQAVEIAF
jgi:hypothetical protein